VRAVSRSAVERATSVAALLERASVENRLAHIAERCRCIEGQPMPELLPWLLRMGIASVSVPELAGAFGVSEARLRRRTARAYGRSPEQLIAIVRSLVAHVVLSSTLLSSDEVAERLGWSSAGSLARALKRESGLTLSEARRWGTTDSSGLRRLVGADVGWFANRLRLDLSDSEGG
jgi:AraC-like DNA-binding protein